MKYNFTLFFILCCSWHIIQAQQEIKVDSLHESDFIDFAQHLNEAMIGNKSSFFIDHFDKETVNLILSETPDTTHTKLYKNKIIKELRVFVGKIHMSVNSGSFYDFISYTTDENNIHYATFRLYSETVGINYHQYIIKPAGTSYVIQDIYILHTGEYVSKTIVNSFSTSFVKNSEKDKDLYQKFITLKNMGLDKKAYQIAEKIKDSAFINKSFLILKANAASAVSDEAYVKSLEEVLTRYPKDACLTLISLDYFYLVKDFNNLFRAIDDLEDYTNDDFLEYFRGTYAYEIEEFYMAQEAFEYVAKAFPSFVTADIMLLHTYTKLNNTPKALELLDTMVEDGIPKQKLIKYIKTDIHDFYKTKDFKRWKRK